MIKDKNFGVIETYGKIAQTSKGNYIVVQKIAPHDTKKTPYIDVRHFFTDARGNLRPDSRGVRIYEDILVDVAAVILSALTPEELKSCLEKVARMELQQDQHR